MQGANTNQTSQLNELMMNKWINDPGKHLKAGFSLLFASGQRPNVTEEAKSIDAVDEWPCMGIELNIWEGAKASVSNDTIHDYCNC